ncbi:ribosome biogenesis GTPase Der [Candidatus Uhrbacteria bacterium]|nr:ribosome biogenesis GTPase Der [Candidatus Uhrbacteria bacterium]
MRTIALIGRTNVGKSSLFNRIIGSAKALTSALPHTTRDRNTGTTVWRGVTIRCIDSGGIEELPATGTRRGGRAPSIEEEIRVQAAHAVADADILVLVVDARDGLLPGERAIANTLRKTRKPILIAWNKAETKRLRDAIGDAYALGFGDPTPTSAVTGMGVGDLLDRIVEGQKAGEPESQQANADTLPSSPALHPSSSTVATRVAIVGEPNVGKSSLLNAILGREEVIVLPEPFTTRDVHDVDITVDGQTITLLDTAGIRRLAMRAARSSHTTLEAIERLAVRRSLAAIRRATVVALVLDAEAKASRHTQQLADAIVEEGRACIIIVNKTDRFPERPHHETITQTVHTRIPHLSWAPVLPTSAIAGSGVPAILPAAIRAAFAWQRTLTPDQLAAIHALVKRRIPRAKTKEGRRKSDILELQQTDTAPPAFTLKTRKRIRLPKAIPAIVERAIRDSADFFGTPIRITVKSVKG